jgi:transposase-like protein
LSESSTSPALDARALGALARTRDFSTASIRLLLQCKEMILLAKGLALGEWRESRDPVSDAFAEHCQAEVKCAELREALAIVRGRILRMPAARRKRYSPEERYQIVTLVRTYGLTLAAAGDLFMVDAQTISRWTNEAVRDPDAKTIGSLLKASPPLRSTSDVTRELVALLDSLAVGGSRKIAQMLVRAGARISRETVRRLRKRKPQAPPANPPPSKKQSVVRAKAANHVWMTDLTHIPSFLRICTFRLAVGVIPIFVPA